MSDELTGDCQAMNVTIPGQIFQTRNHCTLLQHLEMHRGGEWRSAGGLPLDHASRALRRLEMSYPLLLGETYLNHETH